MEDQAPTGVQTRLLVGACVLFLIALWGLHHLSVGAIPAEIRHNPLIEPVFPWATPVLAIIAALLGIYIVRAVTWLISERSTNYLGPARVRSAKALISTVLYILLAIVVASQTQIDLSGIALSGAVTGVIVGIAAQASLANVIAGLVILFARPFRTGQYVTVRAAAFAGSEYSGEVGEITLFYTALLAGSQEIRVPNSTMVTGVVTLRPQVFDVYLPIILPPARWEHLSTTDLARRLTAALPPGRLVTATVERVEDAAVHVGLRASVASDQERSILEGAVLQALHPWHGDDATGPHPEGE